MRHLLLTPSLILAGCVSPAPLKSPEPAAIRSATYDPATDQLAAPTDYRSWAYLTSGYRMSYGPAAVAANEGGVSTFDTVFVDPESHAAFLRTGTWPDRTVFVLEIRTGERTGSIVTRGEYQTDLMALEAEIKDARVPGGWAFFSFELDPRRPAAPPSGSRPARRATRATRRTRRSRTRSRSSTRRCSRSRARAARCAATSSGSRRASPSCAIS